MIVAAAVLAGAAYFYLSTSQEEVLPEGVAFGNGRVEAVQVDISTKIPGRVEAIGFPRAISGKPWSLISIP